MDSRMDVLGAAGAGSLGPRLLGRLTAELILRSPQYMNCCKDYEIDLRGNKISEIENLGATENQFDSIDLSDNAIVRLEGFPTMKRLKQLLLSNNRIMRIGNALDGPIPNLEILILSNNKLANLSDIDPLASLPRLTHLSLLENPVTKNPNYRLYTINKLKNLKVLDFRKVKISERQQALAKFGSGADAQEGSENTFDPGENLPELREPETQEAKQSGPTPEQLTAIQAAIANAQTLEEVARLEEALATGVMPSGLGGPTAMDEG